LTKEDLIEIVVNGETVTKFSVPTKTEKSFGALKEYIISGCAAKDEMEMIVVLCPKKEELKIQKTADVVNTPTVMIPTVWQSQHSEHPILDISTNQVVTPSLPEEPKVEPIAVPEKKQRKPRTPKAKQPVEQPVAVEQPVVVEELPRGEIPTPATTVVSGDVNLKRVPVLVQLIGFYCTALKKEPATMTIEMLKSDSGALDIVEFDNDATINAALEELRKK
jgi:hypothetical protein